MTSLQELLESPESYLDVSVSFKARYKGPEQNYEEFHTSFTPKTHIVFSVWPEDAKLWQPRDRKTAIPYLFLSKINPSLTVIRNLSKYQIVTVYGTVQVISRGLPCIEVTEVKAGHAPLINDARIESFQAAVESVETNPRFAMDQLNKILSREKLPPLFRATAEKYIGRCRLIRGEDKKAIGRFAEAATVLDKDPELFLWKGVAECRAGAVDAASMSLERSLMLDPNDAYARSVLGVILGRQGRSEEAIAQCKKAVELSGRNPAIYWNYGDVLVDQRRYAEAADILEKARKLERGDVKIEKKLGSVYIVLGRLERALERYTAAVNVAPDDAEAHFGLADVCVRMEKWSQAKEEYLKAISLDGRNREYHLALAGLHVNRDEFLAAADRFNKVLGLDPLCVEAHFQLGLISERDGRWEKALESFLKVVELDSRHEMAYRHLVACYSALQDVDKMVWAMEEVVELDRKDHETRFALGELYNEKGNHGKAVFHLAICVKQQPRNANYQLALALAQQFDGKTRDAEKSYRRTLVLNPNSALACNNLAYIYLMQGKKDDATFALARKAHELAPDRPAFLDTIGWVLYMRGKADEAWEYLDASYHDEPSAEVAYHLGVVLIDLDKLDEAERLLNESLREKGDWRRDARGALKKIAKLRDRKAAAAKKTAKTRKRSEKLVKPEGSEGKAGKEASGRKGKRDRQVEKSSLKKEAKPGEKAGTTKKKARGKVEKPAKDLDLASPREKAERGASKSAPKEKAKPVKKAKPAKKEPEKKVEESKKDLDLAPPKKKAGRGGRSAAVRTESVKKKEAAKVEKTEKTDAEIELAELREQEKRGSKASKLTWGKFTWKRTGKRMGRPERIPLVDLKLASPKKAVKRGRT